jgi:transcriptional regulator with XRE-family HTH domain
MPDDADVWQALLRAKGLTVAQLAEDLRTTRQHAHRLLTGKRSAEARREELDRALALGPRRTKGRPLYAVATLRPDGELELVPAGDTQPLYVDRDVATSIAQTLQQLDEGICVVPLWPEYAWRRTVAFHAAWGSTAEPRNVFLVDDPDSGVPPRDLLDELSRGYAVTVGLRAVAEDPLRLQEVESLIGEEEVVGEQAAWQEEEVVGEEGALQEEEEEEALREEEAEPVGEEAIAQEEEGAGEEAIEALDQEPTLGQSGDQEATFGQGDDEESPVSPRQRISGYLRYRERRDDTSDTVDSAADQADAEWLH